MVLGGGQPWRIRNRRYRHRSEGTVTDLNKSNSRSVELQVKIEGYSPKKYTAPTDKDLGVPYSVHWTGDETVVRDGYWQTCQNNTVTTDNCSGWTHKVNPYS